MQSGGIDKVGSGKIYLVGAGVGGARICHAGREICAPAARGQSGGETACPLTAASPSAWSASPPASAASPTSRNAPCSPATSTVWLHKGLRHTLIAIRPQGRVACFLPNGCFFKINTAVSEANTLFRGGDFFLTQVREGTEHLS